MDFSNALSWMNIRFLLQGLVITIEVALLTIVFSVIIGLVFGIIRYLKIPVVTRIFGLVIDTIRNLPLLLIIFFTYFALPRIGIRLDIFWATVAAMTVFESAMISEIVRGGLESLPKGQTEAGLSTGFTQAQILRYITVPQMLRDTLPSIVSQLIALIKDTSLATIIALPELTHNAKIIYGQNTDYVIPMFVALAAFYFIVCYGLSQFSKVLERKLRTS